MKRTFIGIMVLLMSSALVAQDHPGWYNVFTGNVGNMQATMHLHKAGDSYCGYIWFAQNQWPMPLYYNVSPHKNDSLEISAMGGSLSFVFSGVLTDKAYTGKTTLQKDNNAAKSATFQLQVSDDKIFTPFNFYSANGTAKLLPQIKNESEASYLVASIWPSENNLLSTAVKKHVQKALQIKVPIADPSKWMTDEKNKFLTNWKKENSKMSPKEASEMGLSLSVEQEDRVMVMYENEQMITVAHYSFGFSGGAHGDFTTALETIQKSTGKKVLLSDVLNPAGIKALPLILDKVARVQFEIKNNNPLDQNYFLVNKIPLSENFYVTSKGIGFLYAPYVIKSFADGEINLLVPFTVLGPYLQPAFKH